MKRKTGEKNVKLKLIYVTIKYRNQEDCKNTTYQHEISGCSDDESIFMTIDPKVEFPNNQSQRCFWKNLSI